MQTWEIIKGKLWQGSLIGLAESVFTPFDLVISCTWLSRLIPDAWKIHLSYPFADEAKLPNLLDLKGIGEFAAALIGKQDKTCLVNCNAGQNRSGLVCGVIMLSLGLDDVVDKIKAAHPEALHNTTFVDYLNKLEAEGLY